MRRRTPAKVNLFLEVGGLRSDGYHDIVSLIDPVGLFDLIDFSPARNWKVTFLPQTGIDSRDNTVTRVLSLLQQHLAGFPPMKITVKKGIPLGAGLGGGSSDAACVLRVLNKLLGINFSRTRLLRLAERVGADVPAFIGGERCLVWGKGEKIKAIPARCKLWYVILLPARPVSTASVYAWYDRLKHQGDLTEARRKIRILIKKLDEGDVAGARRCLFNRLQEASEKEYPEIRKMR
ncbi:MAG TPA: 4-(cytidine 5'-diphospho)-2-C-methyl-D-erythritol kinase, partial [bacterium]|nr:4-(cytidine 5'-diphospho)-2-C-methyl-D-erythritol kinase [bacterium]